MKTTRRNTISEDCEDPGGRNVLATTKPQTSEKTEAEHHSPKQMRRSTEGDYDIFENWMEWKIADSRKRKNVDDDEEQDVYEKSEELRKIDESRKRIENSEYVEQTIQILSNQSKEPITKIVCFGIGRIRHCYAARYQLAYILAIKSSLGLKSIEFHEPDLNHHDKDLLEALDCQLYPVNCKGKYEFASSETTLVYLPYCPKQLVNNLLWKNWSADALSQIILISNSFRSIIQNTPPSMAEEIDFISRVLPCTHECSLKNSFNANDVFFDMSLHYFLPELFDENIFDTFPEPIYTSIDLNPKGIMNKDTLVFEKYFGKYNLK